MKIVNLYQELYGDKIVVNWSELGFKDRLKACIAIMIGIKLTINGKLKLNIK